MKPHWTDPHILFDENEGKFIAYDEAGLEHSRWDSHNEARDALVIYAAVELENAKVKNKGHVHAELMAQYAEDARTNEEPWKLWEFKRSDGEWYTSLNSSPSWSKTFIYRRKIKTHTVNGVEIPDLRVTQKHGDHFYLADPVSRYFFSLLEDDEDDMVTLWIERGLVYQGTEEGKQAAIKHAKAWLGLVQQ